MNLAILRCLGDKSSGFGMSLSFSLSGCKLSEQWLWVFLEGNEEKIVTVMKHVCSVSVVRPDSCPLRCCDLSHLCSVEAHLYVIVPPLV